MFENLDVMTVAAYAAKQPRPNRLWQDIVANMIKEIEDYLSFWTTAKGD